MLDQQVEQLGKVLRAGPNSLLWASSLAPLSLSVEPLVSHYVRRVGRPKREWVPAILDEAHRRNFGHHDLLHLASSKV